MNKIYIVLGIVCVVLVGGLLSWKALESHKVLGEKTSAPVATPTVLTSTPSTTLKEMREEKPVIPMKTKQYSAPPSMTIDSAKTYVANLVTDKGTMRVTLFANDVPVTVNNFVFLAREGFYNDTVFHRVISGFMIQGGDPLGNGTGSPGYRFNDEKITREYTRGTLAMANSGPNTNGSQFFIMHATYPLPKNYVIFGSIDAADAASLATLDAIAASTVTDNGMGERSKPVTPTIVTSVTIEEK